MSLFNRASPPFGLRNGSTFTPARTLEPLLDGYSELQLPGPEIVCACGEVDLGESVRLLRYYLDNDDYWLQVLMHGSQPGDIVLFGYHSAIAVRDEAHRQYLVGCLSKVGLPIYTHEGCLYSRQWGQAQGQAELIQFHEQVVNPQTRYGVQHLSMLYARDTGLLDRREFLLFSLEEDEHGALTFTTSLGVTLFPTDFNVT